MMVDYGDRNRGGITREWYVNVSAGRCSSPVITSKGVIIARIVSSVLILILLQAVGLPAQATDTPLHEVASVDARRVITSQRMQDLLQVIISLELSGVTLEEALRNIVRQSGIELTYQDALVRNHPLITVARTRITVGEALKVVLAGTGLEVETRPSGAMTLRKIAGMNTKSQATGTITGSVTDSTSGDGVKGATISLQGTALSVTTAENGRFVLRGVPTGTHVMSVKVFGYKVATQSVTVSAGKSVSVQIVLVPVLTTLSGVVTTATGTQRKLEVGTDITTLDVDSIRKAAPVASVTDLLENRVPGLVVQRASGAPGAPSRVRIRGLSSINGSNDPIIIVDGVRVYSDQTTGERDAQFSVLDQIDIQSLETVEVLKGPSASALYGSDAANGVIVITTKHGGAGQTRWTFSMDQQVTTQPGTFSDQYYREGTPLLLGGRPVQCTLTADPCRDTRLITYNPLADSRTTVLGTGRQQSYNAGVSGGSSTVTYFLNGSLMSDIGLLKMSDADVAFLERSTGMKVPRWQRRPQGSEQASGTVRLQFQPSPTLALSVTTALTQNKRRTTPLDRAIGIFESGALPEDTSLVSGSIPDFRRQTTWRELSERGVVNGTWTQIPWLTVAADAGVQTAVRRQEQLLRRGDCIGCGDSVGRVQENRDDRSVGTVNLRSSVQLPERFGFRFTPSFGVNYVQTNATDAQVDASKLPLGGSTVNSAEIISANGHDSKGVQLGMYLNTGVSLFNRLFTSFGTRVDASNALGKNVTPAYPKLDLSYLISEEPFFPSQLASSLRLRIAYGHSAVQPDVGAALRTYKGRLGMVDEVVGPVQVLSTYGNPDLRPERSTELEGGFDLGVLQDRLTLSITLAHKLTRDALVTVQLPPSLGQFDVGNLWTNLGAVQNTTAEVTLDARLIDGDAVTWGVNGYISRLRNKITKLDPGFNRDYQGTLGTGFGIYGTRYVEGYPLNGYWVRPVARYTDVNEDGVVSDQEIVRADSSVFIGGPLPNYTVSLGTTLGFWNGRLAIAANASYEDGMSQINLSLLENLRFPGSSTFRAANDPTTPISEQLAYRSGYAAIHTVSTLRLSSLSVRLMAPVSFARRVGASAMSVALQGSNLGLWTNYVGSDPNVTSSIVGNQRLDRGELPQPRMWRINVSLNY